MYKCALICWVGQILCLVSFSVGWVGFCVGSGLMLGQVLCWVGEVLCWVGLVLCWVGLVLWWVGWFLCLLV